jgi:hypothetical protein
VQGMELHHPQEQEKPTGPFGDQKILSKMSNTHRTQGKKIRRRSPFFTPFIFFLKKLALDS